nr:retrovirus-related Pol polyprotein from transposon TNT 1-94 [Tanacetum cinerariifolium]
MSLVKADYVAAGGCYANILWMKSQLTDYDIIYEKVPIFCDNTDAIAISNSPVLHSRTKHIDIRYHFIRDHILKEDTKLHFIPTQYQLADIFTKPLDDATFKRLIVELGTNLSAFVDKTKFARDGLKTTHTVSSTNKESRSKEMSKKIKMEDLSRLIQDTRFTFFTLDTPLDEPIIVSDESEEEQTERHEEPKDTSVPPPPSPNSIQLQELLDQVYLLQSQKDKLEQKKAKAEAEVVSLIATPSYPDINQLTKLLIAELKTLKWELPVEFLALPSQISPVQAKLQTLDTLPILLNKVSNTLNRFASIIKNASHTTTHKGVPSAGPTAALPAKGEKNTNPATMDADTTNLHKELVNLLGINIVTQYYNKKLLYNKYCDKMLKRRKSSKIINCDVLIQKGPITLKIYRKDRTIEVIPNVKSIFSLCYLFRKSFSSTTMGDANPIRTFGDYSKLSHEGYRNTIELPKGNNVVPLPSDTIWKPYSPNEFCIHQKRNFKEDEAKEEGSVGSSAIEYKNHEMTVKAEEELKRKEEFKEETKEEIKEEEEDSPEHFDTFPTMKELRLEPRRKPSNPKKVFNFMGRVKGLKDFVRNFTYKCDFVVTEDTISIIDHDLASVIFRKPFVKMTGLAYDIKEGTVMFEKDKEKIMFKIPHKMEMFKHIDFTNIKTDRIRLFVI